MPDEKAVVAEPSSAQTEIEVPQDPGAYATWRQTGKVPAPKKPAAPPAKPKPGEPAAPDAHKGEDSERDSAEHAPDTESGDGTQEHRQGGKKSAEDRIRQLTARIKELEGNKKDGKTEESSTSKTDEKRAEQKPSGPPRPKAEDFKTYDEYFEALAEWKADQKIVKMQADQAQAAQAKELQGKLTEARTRYGAEADNVIQATSKAVFEDKAIPGVIKAMVDESSVLVDLLYVMGSKADELAEFIDLAKKRPGEAVRKLVLLERLVQEELTDDGKKKGKGDGEEEADAEGSADEGRDEHGRFIKPGKPPEKKKPETPHPPSELSGRGPRPTDAVESAVKNDDFRAFRRSANARDVARRKGE